MSPTVLADLAAEIEIVDDTTISKAIHKDDRLKAVLFGFAAGQELSEHTAAVPAILHIITGESVVTLGDEVVHAHAGAWMHMPARLPHSISAVTPVKMLLLLLETPSR